MDSIEEIKKLNKRIDALRNECTEELNEINYAFWPEIATLKKKKKKYSWLVTIFGCVVFGVVLLLLLFEIKNEYWIGISLGLSISFLIYFIVRLIIAIKKYNKKDTEWQKLLVEPLKKKDELNELQNKCVEMMKNTINDKEVTDELGDDYNDVFSYYDSWVQNID